MAGGLALAGVLSEAGLRTSWLDRWRLNWGLTSDQIADKAYAEFLAGRRQEAAKLFDVARQRDPASPYRWCDYGEALLFGGDRERARRAVARGVELGPYLAPIRMRAVNFAYRESDQPSALEQSKALLALTDRYDDTVFEIWKRMEIPTEAALRSGIPDGRAARAYIRRLIGAASLDPAKQAWSFARASGFLDDKTADEYARFLLSQGEFRSAASAWTAYAGSREPGYPHQNAIFNGGFERELIGRTFDWRIDPVAGARAERDSSLAADGHDSLRVDFAGTENVSFSHVSQRVVVPPGDWELLVRLRSEGVSTDEGFRIRILDPEDPRRVNVATESLTGTHEWATVATRFTVPASTNLLEIRFVRYPTWKFDRRIRGSVWVDNVVLRRASHSSK